jgi:hypothetical protein
MKVDEKKFHAVMAENDVLKNMLRSLHIFSHNAEMTFEAYYKTMDKMVRRYNELVMQGETIDFDRMDKILIEIDDSLEKENNALS